MSNLLNIPRSELDLRLEKIREGMSGLGADALLVSANANIYYLTGRVFAGYILITDRECRFFIRRPLFLEGENIDYIRKPEEIPSILGDRRFSNVAIEMNRESYSGCLRLMKLFPEAEFRNADTAIDSAREVKTPAQIELIRESGIMQTEVYRKIPDLYRPGMTDTALQIAIETESRLHGCLGQFRISGNSMELFMANILAGDNADNPTPYDFAMGGAGADPSLPVGADGTVIRPGMSVMIDCNGNYTGYMTDMTRTFALGELAPEAVRAHECSIRICREVAAAGIPGAEASALYRLAAGIAEKEGLGKYFMGHRQKAGFVGHGVGIEINESPVIAPKSRHVLQAGNVIALEPKFVIPGTGAVGIENTYLVTENGGMVSLTTAPEEIIRL